VGWVTTGAPAGEMTAFWKKFARIQECVAVELEHIAVEVVRALLDGGTDDCSTIAVVLGVERAGDEVELLKSVDVLAGRRWCSAAGRSYPRR